MNDRGLAALAEREGLVHRVRGLVGVDPHRLMTETVASWTAHAAAILGEHGVFLPDGLAEGMELVPTGSPGSPEWEAGYNRGKEDSNIATIATITALRATLTEIRDTARSTYSQRCQWCDPLSLAQLILRPHRPDCPAAIAAVALGTP